MLKKIISGGQTGVDICALRAAQKCGIETGGAMPAGFRTLPANRDADEQAVEAWLVQWFTLLEGGNSK